LNYIIDTNILLDYPQIVEDKNNQIYIATSVLKELDGLKKHINNDIAFNARRAAIYISRNLNQLLFVSECEKWGIPVDDQLIKIAKIKNGILITNDVYLKVRATIDGVETKGYNNKDDYTGVEYWYVDSIDNEKDQEDLSKLLNDNILPPEIVLYENQYLIIKEKSTDKTIKIYVIKNGKLEEVENKKIRNQWIDYIYPRNSEQTCLFNALSNKDNTIIYAGGKYGTGKSFILNNFALQELEKGNIRKIIYIPNNSYVEGSMELGFLPGTDIEKVIPSIGPLIDLVGKDFVNQMIMKEELEIVPLAYIRGRSFKDSIIIVNEAQNLTEDHLKLLIARCGENSRIFFDGDIKQADSQLFRNKNGLKLLLNLRKSPIYCYKFATVNLLKTERSATAEAAQYLDDLMLGE
jgi:PhoH-like ATPase